MEHEPLLGPNNIPIINEISEEEDDTQSAPYGVERPHRRTHNSTVMILPHDVLGLLLTYLKPNFVGKMAVTNKAFQSLAGKNKAYSIAFEKAKAEAEIRRRKETMERRQAGTFVFAKVAVTNIFWEASDIGCVFLATLLLALRLEGVIAWPWVGVMAPLLLAAVRMFFIPLVIAFLVRFARVKSELSYQGVTRLKGMLFSNMYWSLLLISRDAKQDQESLDRFFFFHSTFASVPLSIFLTVLKLQLGLDSMPWSVPFGVLVLGGFVAFGTLVKLSVTSKIWILFFLLGSLGLTFVTTFLMMGLKLDLPALADANWFAVTSPLFAMELAAMVGGILLLWRKRCSPYRRFQTLTFFMLMVMGPLEVATTHVLVLLRVQYGMSQIPYIGAFAGALLFEAKFIAMVITVFFKPLLF